MRDVYVARQPIFDRHQQVHAYEVLFRNSRENRAIVDDAARATTELLFNCFVTIGLDRIVGGHPAFINLTREFLIGDWPLPIAPERMVIEVLEDIVIDEPLVRGVRKLVDDGYRIALDDVVIEDRLRPLLPLATYVKVELPRIPRAERGRQLEQFRAFDIAVLAEKVETQEDFDLCLGLGYDLMQGFFFSRPQMLRSREVPNGQLAILQLMGQLNRPDVTIEDLERTLRTDASLSFKLLRFLDSARRGVPRRVESLHQAIQFLGLWGIRVAGDDRVDVEPVLRTPGDAPERDAAGSVVREARPPDFRLRPERLLYGGAGLRTRRGPGDVLRRDCEAPAPFGGDPERGRPPFRSDGDVIRCAESHERLDSPIGGDCGSLKAEEVRNCYLEALADLCEIFA